MKAVAENHAANFQRPGRSGNRLSDELLLTKIGDDLRHLYTDITDAEQPCALLGLAQAIDARRSGGSQPERAVAAGTCRGPYASPRGANLL